MGRPKINNRLGAENINRFGCLMKIVEYNSAQNIVVEFQDKYKGKVHTDYKRFQDGAVKNPYLPNVFGVGMIGTKYKSKENGKNIKEYETWHGVLERSYSNNLKQIRPTYKNITCCDEWLLYENFYEWIHSQENFDKWLNGKRWAIDKDILIKGNKIYSPETCCLVPMKVNALFIKSDSARGELPIGVRKHYKKFRASCRNPFTNKEEILGDFLTVSDAFNMYKQYKENIIQQIAKEEFANGNITEACYIAMTNYKVEITD